MRAKLGTSLVIFGALAWVPYGIVHYALGIDIPVLPFLVWHLLGVVPGSYLSGGPFLLVRLGRSLIRRCREKSG